MNRHTMARVFWGLTIILLPVVQSVPQEQPGRVKVMQLANQIRKNILMLPNYGPFDYLTFGIGPGTNGYKVTLRGYASRPTLKSSAENVVKQLETVEGVENTIEVLPTSPNDEDIRLAAYAKIYYNNWLSRYNPSRGMPLFMDEWDFERTAMFGISQRPPMGYHPMSIIVKNGHIILEGVIDTDGDKNMAGIQANQVSGVFSVTNNLTVLKPEVSKKEGKG